MKKDSNFILKITLLAGHHRGPRNILYAPWLGFCVGSPMQSVTGREDTESVGQIYFSVASLPAPALDRTTFERPDSVRQFVALKKEPPVFQDVLRTNR